MSVIDVGGEVREGEELDIGAVENWLKNQGVELVGPAVVTQYTGGASNWTYRLKYENTDLILRRPPKGTKRSRPTIWPVNIWCRKTLHRIIRCFLKWWHFVRMSRSLAVILCHGTH